MSLIINIDSTSGTAVVNIADNGAVLFEETNAEQNNHAAFLQPAIQKLVKKTGINIREIDAVAVSHGPGSYTGLRVGMATAKGLCYALGKPLITVSQLEVLTKDIIDNAGIFEEDMLYCPMIDARRMEVFTALYDKYLSEALSPLALILDANSFCKFLLKNKVVFFGSGADKWQQLCKHENAFFTSIVNKGLALSRLAFEKFRKNELADLAYAEPLYIKEFYTSTNA
ncbi:MAG: tRNA (adenosine(37)-N6)-threonylcarbamoyltransferase complex dimerization subunit type 1 TsaB [Bacteroidota bacterium]